MSPSTKLWDRHAAGYAKSPVKDEASYQKKLEVTREYLQPDMEVLELACPNFELGILCFILLRDTHCSS